MYTYSHPGISHQVPLAARPISSHRHPARPGHMESVRLEPFAHLSSLSVNCTDECAAGKWMNVAMMWP